MTLLTIIFIVIISLCNYIVTNSLSVEYVRSIQKYFSNTFKINSKINSSRRNVRILFYLPCTFSHYYDYYCSTMFYIDCPLIYLWSITCLKDSSSLELFYQFDFMEIFYISPILFLCLSFWCAANPDERAESII